jgi:hypothetical protein
LIVECSLVYRAREWARVGVCHVEIAGDIWALALVVVVPKLSILAHNFRALFIFVNKIVEDLALRLKSREERAFS